MEGDIAVVRTFNSKREERLVKTKKYYWENAQFSRQDTIEIVGIPNSVDNRALEKTVRGVFKKIGVKIEKRDVQVCHRLKEKERTSVKFVNKKDCLQILKVKKEL